MLGLEGSSALSRELSEDVIENSGAFFNHIPTKFQLLSFVFALSRELP